ncbi:MAG TPA: hypothetical protein VF750_09250, partial [Sphingomicrobium sp.]
MSDQNEPEQPAAPKACPEPVEAPCPEPVEGMRTLSLNSREFHEAVTEPRPSWCWGPGLPRDKSSWTP